MFRLSKDALYESPPLVTGEFAPGGHPGMSEEGRPLGVRGGAEFATAS